MPTETATDLLEAVGINADTGGTCPSGHRLFMGGDYTGPALGSPELDALLLVAGQRWLVAHSTSTCTDVERFIESRFGVPHAWFWLLCMNDQSGHALARAIREARG